jgi:hypothetical protein
VLKLRRKVGTSALLFDRATLRQVAMIRIEAIDHGLAVFSVINAGRDCYVFTEQRERFTLACALIFVTRVTPSNVFLRLTASHDVVIVREEIAQNYLRDKVAA